MQAADDGFQRSAQSVRAEVRVAGVDREQATNLADPRALSGQRVGFALNRPRDDQVERVRQRAAQSSGPKVSGIVKGIRSPFLIASRLSP